MKASIIANGNIESFGMLQEEINSSEVILCADGGAEYAYRYGITPHYLIGDFDSISSDVLEFYNNQKIEILKYPKEKDFTDTEICVNKALELGCSEICIIAGVGGRIDHSLGNIGLLHLINKNGAQGCITGNDCIIYLCSSEISIQGEIGDTISVIPYMGNAEGLNSSGLKYALSNSTIEFGKPTGVSNIMVDTSCKITIANGEVLVIKQLNI
jgi:thiamine pyrophosphokinase